MTGGRPVLKAVVLDFDGVVLESADIKTAAFAWIFREHRAHLPRIVAYHQRNAGVSRFVKFAHIHRVLLRLPFGPAARRRLGETFARRVWGRLLAAPFVPGALAFLKKYHERVRLFIVSGTPTSELRRLVRRRGLSPYLTAVRGAPPDKTAVLGRLLRRYGLRPAEVLCVGDALGDWRAAKARGVPFVARVPARQRSVFPGGTPRVSDLRGAGRWIEKKRTILPKEKIK